ncbi:MAG: tetratricopeptide repeat protein [Pirellulales bacterium]|nr:tetratricopeptide repeat protein [Pirellulales bacterium]
MIRWPRTTATFWSLVAGAVTTAALSGCASPPTLPGERLSMDLDHAPPARRAIPFVNKKKEAEQQFLRQIAKGRTLESSGKLVEARDLYQAMIVEFPDRYETYHRLGIVADKQRRHREAQALYSQAIERAPTEAQLFNDLGYCFFLQGQLDKAESALFKAVNLAPSEARYRNNLGLVYGHQGRMDQALVEFRKAGSEADAQYNVAFIYASRDDNNAAKTCFQKALAADPTHENSRRALQSFTRFEADPSAAEVAAEYAPNGARYVPYVEPGQAPPGTAAAPQVLPASAIGPARASAGGNTGPSTMEFPGSTTHGNAASAAVGGSSGVTTASHWSWKGTSQFAQ